MEAEAMIAISGLWPLPPTPTPPLQGEGRARAANFVVYPIDWEGPLPLEGRDRVGGILSGNANAPPFRGKKPGVSEPQPAPARLAAANH